MEDTITSGQTGGMHNFFVVYMSPYITITE
jgi:hypothetical protein